MGVNLALVALGIPKPSREILEWWGGRWGTVAGSCVPEFCRQSFFPESWFGQQECIHSVLFIFLFFPFLSLLTVTAISLQKNQQVAPAAALVAR